MSYTPNTWQTGDTVTATKLNNMETGIGNAIRPDYNPNEGNKGDVMRVLWNEETNKAEWILASQNSVDTFAEYVEITFDENSFSTDATPSDLTTKWSRGYTLFAMVAGFYCPLFPAPYVSFFSGLSFQTNLVALDALEMPGKVGYLSLSPDEGAYDVNLFFWDATSL